MKPKKPTNLLDLMTPADRQRAIERAKERQETHDEVSPEMYFVAEFGYYFGWEGIAAIKNNLIQIDEARVLCTAARKVWYSKVVDSAHGSLVAVNSAQSKNPGGSFTKGIKTFVKRMKVNG